MANRDINLFKAAGGERAKGTKRSPMTYMVMLTIFVAVVVVGVLLYFNIQASAAVSAYEESVAVGDNYARTKVYCAETSKEFKQVESDLNAAATISAYVDQESAFYPHLTQQEVDAVKETILNGAYYSVNDPMENEPFTVWDYEGLRESLYEEGESEIEDRALFYYAIQKLADEQKKYPASKRTNIWYAYYRCYFVVVFQGGNGDGLDSLANNFLISESQTMAGQKPFSVVQMENETYYDGNYMPAKYISKIYNEDTYNIMLLPVKSVIERAFDILEAHTAAVVEENGWENQLDLVAYGVDEINFTNERLKFKLTLPNTVSFKHCLDEFAASVFFNVSESVNRFESTTDGSTTSYEIELYYGDSVGADK